MILPRLLSPRCSPSDSGSDPPDRTDRVGLFGCSNLLALVVGALLWTGCATAIPAAPPDEVHLWGRWEGTFTIEESIDGDVDPHLIVELTAPSGSTHAVPGFWDGGDVWKARFMPDETGLWRYRTRAEPAVAGLDDQSGRFEVRRAQNAPSDASGRFLRHGPVRVSENGRYLEHEDGTPFFWVMDTAWSGALKSTAADWQTYLADRVSKAFTGIQFVTTQWRAARSDRQDQRAYSGYEDIAIHPEFFQRLDRRVDAINDAGLLAAPVVLWAYGDDKSVPGNLPEDQAIRLAEYITARYGAHHVAWFLAGDEIFSGDQGKRWRRIGRAVFEPPRHEALATVHPQGRQWDVEAFREEDWYDFIIYQSSHGGDPQTLNWIHSGPPARNWQNDPPLPVINSEPGYEDLVGWVREEPHTAFDVRQQAYYSLLSSPPAGISYGAHGVWSWETEPSVPLNHEGTGVAKPWDDAIHLPGSEDLKHLTGLFRSIDWHTLRPAQDVLVDPPNDPAEHVAAARSTEGNRAVVYLPDGGTIRLNEEMMDRGLEGQWMNPRTGDRRAAAASAPYTYTTPDDRDWVLLLQ